MRCTTGRFLAKRIRHGERLGSRRGCYRQMGRYMDDTLEMITVDTSLADELEFFEFVCGNGDVRLISTDVSENGPRYLSIEDIPRMRMSAAPNDHTLLLWNTAVPTPLCWHLYLSNYNSEWEPIDPRYATRSEYPRNTDEGLALFASFQRQQITEQILRYGRIDSLLSPVIEVDIPTGKPGDFFSVTTEFSNWATGIWVVWNALDSRWEHETRDVERLLEYEYAQPPAFIEWQEGIFDWIREAWPGWIIPRYTYRLVPEDLSESTKRLAQALANLMGRTVAGFEPQPPVESPRSEGCEVA